MSYQRSFLYGVGVTLVLWHGYAITKTTVEMADVTRSYISTRKFYSCIVMNFFFIRFVTNRTYVGLVIWPLDDFCMICHFLNNYPRAQSPNEIPNKSSYHLRVSYNMDYFIFYLRLYWSKPIEIFRKFQVIEKNKIAYVNPAYTVAEVTKIYRKFSSLTSAISIIIEIIEEIL